MKFALITGPRGFDLVDEKRLGYHLVLAQEVLNDPAMGEFYYVKHCRGHFIMVDNGAAEGVYVPFRSVLEVAGQISADEIILPDVLDDMVGTLHNTLGVAHLVPQKQRAVVPQGRSWAEWQTCVNEFVRMGCATICVAKRYERLPGGRAHALQLLHEHGLDKTHYIHLLGFDTNPVKEIQQAKATGVDIRGVDSAAPIAYAQQVQLGMEHGHVSYKWNEPFIYTHALHNVNAILVACETE